MRRRILMIFLLLAAVGAGCVSTIAESNDCDRWLAQYKQAVAESAPVHRVLQVHHRLRKYVHRQIAQLKPKPHLVTAAMPQRRTHKSKLPPSEMLRRFSLLCGDLPPEHQVALLEPGPLPPMELDRPGPLVDGPAFDVAGPPQVPGVPISAFGGPVGPGIPTGGTTPIAGFPPSGSPGAPTGGLPPGHAPAPPSGGPVAPGAPVLGGPGTPTPVAPPSPGSPSPVGSTPTGPVPAPVLPGPTPPGPGTPGPTGPTPTGPAPVVPSPTVPAPTGPAGPPTPPIMPPVPAPVPEPNSLVLMLTGTIGIAVALRRRA